jgi:hypothetical protein
MWEDGERILFGGRRAVENGGDVIVLVVVAAGEQLTPSGIPLEREFGLREDLEAAWAARPLELSREAGRTAILLEILAARSLLGTSAPRSKQRAFCASRSASRQPSARSIIGVSSTAT